jgi:hypothetical protein
MVEHGEAGARNGGGVALCQRQGFVNWRDPPECPKLTDVKDSHEDE